MRHEVPTDDGLPRHLRAGANAFQEVGVVLC